MRTLPGGRPAVSALSLSAMLLLTLVAPISAQGGPSPAASTATSAPAMTVPFCSDVPEIVIPADRFGDEPVYVGNEQPTDALRAWARQQPGFEDLWIDRDHLGWVVLAFSEDATGRQSDLEREFPGVGAVAVDVDWHRQDLERLQERAIATNGLVQGSGIDIKRGVVSMEIGLLEPAKLARIERLFAGEPVCISGIDPATLPAQGLQPQAGDGWRLLGEDRVGPPYRTGIAADRASLRALWKRTRLDGRPPAVDFEQEVAIWFGAVYGSSCPAIRLDDVIVDQDAALVHALIVQTEPVTFCTDDANGHAYVVALDRDRLPAPPFRIQLQAADPPPGATKEITLVEADLRVPGSVPGPGEVRTIRPPEEPWILRSGDIMETGFPAPYLLDTRCGVEWLGQLNGIWWRTEVPAGSSDWVPDAWRPSVAADGMLEVSVLLRDMNDPAVTDGRPRAEATANGETVVYHAGTEPRPACAP